MASEREQALQSIAEGPLANVPESLGTALSEGERTKRLAMEHEHAFKLHRADLGWFGIVFGSESHAGLVIAFIVVACGLLAAGGLWWVAYRTGPHDFWSNEAHIALGAVTTALGYVFGRGSKDSPK